MSADWPEGFAYYPDALTEAEESDLLAFIETLNLGPFVFQGNPSLRHVRNFGVDFDYERKIAVEAPPIPAAFNTVLDRVAALTGTPRPDLAELLVTRYPPGASITWHRDSRPFESVFGVSLESDAPLPEPAHSEIGRGERRLHGVRLLVAEDNEVNRLVIEAMLQGEGAEVVMADDGVQAVQALADGLRVDAVLMDVQMPEMDGLEATRRIRARHPQLPVIGQTAHALKDEHARCLAAGMVATVNKPIEIEALVEMILSQLGHLPAPSPVPAAEREMTPSADETASSEGEAPLPVVDWAALEARYSGRREFIERLLALAFEQHVEDAERLKALAREARYEEVATLAHRLKGMAGNLCAHEFEAQAQRYLQAVRGGAAPSAAMIDALVAASERLLGELKGGRPDA